VQLDVPVTTNDNMADVSAFRMIFVSQKAFSRD
jgi:hypothetical protein